MTPPAPREPALDPRRDVVAAVLTAVFVALLGPAVGLVWAALTPRVSIAAIGAGEDATLKAQVGADVRFGEIGVVAGVLCAAVALWAWRGRHRGPGVAVGLGLGGLGAAFIADRVAYLHERPATLAGLHRLNPKAGGDLVALLDVKVRLLGAVTAWPLAALVVFGVAVLIDNRTRRPPAG